MNKEQHLKQLLRPITWGLSSSIKSRQNHVNERHREVSLVYKFLSEEGKKLCDDWFEKESHEGLWD